MAPRRFLDALARGPIVMDSGMGTRLLTQGVEHFRENLTLGNLCVPAAVLGNHRDDIEAGSDALVANTFRADRPTLDAIGRGDDFREINRAGVDLARRAAGPDRFVIGSIAPIEHPDAAAAYVEQAAILAESGCDALMLETHSADQAVRVLNALASVASLPILASLWEWPPNPVPLAQHLESLGAAAIGTNCGRGLDDVAAVTAKLAGAVAVALIAKPSAGVPGGPRFDPDSFAVAAPGLVAMGVGLIGGCCGTNSAHVAAIRRALAKRPA